MFAAWSCGEVDRLSEEPQAGNLEPVIQIQRPLFYRSLSSKATVKGGTHIFLCAFEKVPSQSHLVCAALTLEESAGIKSGARNRKTGEEGHLLR